MIAMTGASGFLGSYIADRLPFPQRRLTRNQLLCSHLFDEHVWIEGDLRNASHIKNFIKDASILVHLACTSHPRTSHQAIGEDIEQNLLPSLNLFEAFASLHPNGHIIFSSSGGNMYDAVFPGASKSEEDLPSPRSPYAIHKLALEHYLRHFCETRGIRATILRLSNPYGTLLPSKRAQGLIGVAFAKLLAGEELPIFDSLDTIRDYIHLEDVAQAFRLVIQHPPLPGECRLFHVSSGVGFSNAAILDFITATTQYKIKKRYPNQALPPASWSVLSCKKIQQQLGWKPTISLPEGIERLWKEILNTYSSLPFRSYALEC